MTCSVEQDGRSIGVAGLIIVMLRALQNSRCARSIVPRPDLHSAEFVGHLSSPSVFRQIAYTWSVIFGDLYCYLNLKYYSLLTVVVHYRWEPHHRSDCRHFTYEDYDCKTVRDESIRQCLWNLQYGLLYTPWEGALPCVWILDYTILSTILSTNLWKDTKIVQLWGYFYRVITCRLLCCICNCNMPSFFL